MTKAFGEIQIGSIGVQRTMGAGWIWGAIDTVIPMRTLAA